MALAGYKSSEDEQGQETPKVFIFVGFIRFLKDSLNMLFDYPRQFVDFSKKNYYPLDLHNLDVDALHRYPV